MMIKKIYLFILILTFWATVQALTPISQKWVPIDRSPNLVRTPPTWFQPHSLATAPTSIDYWMDVLPFPGDRYTSSQYIVVPTLWLVAPIKFWSQADQERFLKGQEVNIDPYLRNWIMYYHGTNWIGSNGNAVYFGHSNHYRNDPGRYKTIFGNIMALDPTVDQLWFYQRQGSSSTYTRYIYSVKQSFQTTPENVQVLLPQWWAEVTLIACTDWLNGRWIIKGQLIDSDQVVANYARWDEREIEKEEITWVVEEGDNIEQDKKKEEEKSEENWEKELTFENLTFVGFDLWPVFVVNYFHDYNQEDRSLDTKEEAKLN